MITTLWTVKGGAGTTVVAASLAALWARRGGPVLAVDLAGDLPAALGIPEPDGPGVGDWLSSDAPADAIDRLGGPVLPGLDLLHRGRAGDCPEVRARDLRRALAGRPGDVVVDAGCAALAAPGPLATCAAELAGAGRSLLVLRPCYLALRRVSAVPGLHADGVVLVAEEGRALGARDVEAVLGLPVVARVAVEPAVARSVDAGTLARRLPRRLQQSLGRVR